MAPPRVYLDHNATTPIRPEVMAVMADALAEGGNPSSVHQPGRRARARLEQARAAVAAGLGLPENGQIIFTSGGTEANFLALNGCDRPVCFQSAIEHESVRTARRDAVLLPVNSNGRVDLDALRGQLAARPGPALVSVMAANNETGILQPLPEIIDVAHQAGALVHSDAVQAIGKIPFDMKALGVDLVTVSAHKFGGPPGVAALAAAPSIRLAAVMPGGGQERGLRGGTQNLPGIVGFAAAITAAVAELDRYAGLAAMRDSMEYALLALAPTARIFDNSVPRLANTTVIALPGLEAATAVMALDLAGIAVSAGSACSSGKLRASPVLTAMGVGPEWAGSAIRISLGLGTARADIDRLLAAWAVLVRRQAMNEAAKRSAV